jgi:hypothetical protein
MKIRESHRHERAYLNPAEVSIDETDRQYESVVERAIWESNACGAASVGKGAETGKKSVGGSADLSFRESVGAAG